MWSIWWNYDGISGPTMWGSMNGEWFMCSRGKNQSPIDIEPNVLLFDPTLKHIEIEGDLVRFFVINAHKQCLKPCIKQLGRVLRYLM